MKKSLFVFLAMYSFGAFASDYKNFLCFDGKNSLNGLDIHTIILNISLEDPEAEMRILYNNRKFLNSNMSYENIDGCFSLKPNSSEDGTISISLCQKSDTWTASVKQRHVDTFSILKCTTL
jgi:hypothetical protein